MLLVANVGFPTWGDSLLPTSLRTLNGNAIFGGGGNLPNASGRRAFNDTSAYFPNLLRQRSACFETQPIRNSDLGHSSGRIYCTICRTLL